MPSSAQPMQILAGPAAQEEGCNVVFKHVSPRTTTKAPFIFSRTLHGHSQMLLYHQYGTGIKCRKSISSSDCWCQTLNSTNSWIKQPISPVPTLWSSNSSNLNLETESDMYHPSILTHPKVLQRPSAKAILRPKAQETVFFKAWGKHKPENRQYEHKWYGWVPIKLYV